MFSKGDKVEHATYLIGFCQADEANGRVNVTFIKPNALQDNTDNIPVGDLTAV